MADGPGALRSESSATALSEPGETAHLAALAGLPGMGPARLRVLLDRWSPREAWHHVTAGSLVRRPEVAAAIRGRREELFGRWQAAARSTDVTTVGQEHVAAGIVVSAPGRPGFPARLADDPEPPAVLFGHGDPDAIGDRTVAVVGTRRCTRYGHDVARDLGRTLALAGVTVVSGLASGIDAAAHQGALEVEGAAPVAVVGTGLDVIYPRRNRVLWERVADRGLVLTEAPLGAPPDPWRFPARNRIIAGLADVVVVVESHVAGGSLYTADEALARDVPVLAVPGPIRSPASEGANRLLADGAVALCALDDVFVALGLVDHTGSSPADGSGADEPVDPPQRAVLDAVDWEPASIDHLVLRTGLGFDAVSLAVERLVASGHLARRGAWLERVSGPSTRGAPSRPV